MRTIKFRGKTNSGNWIFGGLVHSLEDGIEPAIYFPVGNQKCKTMDWAYVDPDSVGQFTGLVDKNGKEIYEGDIIDVSALLSLHVFDIFGYDTQHRAIVKCKGASFVGVEEDDIMWELNWLSEQDPELEVIGNIHDTIKPDENGRL